MITKEIQNTIDKFFNRCEREEKRRLNRNILPKVIKKIIPEIKKKNKYKMMKINNKWISEHRLAMEKHLGRELKKSEIVHHIDLNPSNNNINNLVLCKSCFEHKTAHDVINCNESNIKWKITKDRKLEWEILNSEGNRI